MKHILYTITLSVLITMLISGCGRKAAPKYVEGGFYPKTYPAPDRVPEKNKPEKEKNPVTDTNPKANDDEKK